MWWAPRRLRPTAPVSTSTGPGRATPTSSHTPAYCSERPRPLRLDSPVLIAFAVHEAAAHGLPIQVHVGFGDRDLDLHRTDPMLLLPLLRTMTPVPVLLLHCYPFQRQAGYLAQAFDHVNFDVGLAINYLGRPLDRTVAEALETAPFAKQLYSSDAFGPPELHVLGSVLWRRAMGLVLGGWVRAGDCTEQDAIRIVDMIGVHNAERVYGDLIPPRSARSVGRCGLHRTGVSGGLPASTAAALSTARMPMVSRVASPALAVCGVRTRPGASSSAGLTSRLTFEHIQSGTADLAAAQGVDQRLFVDDATAGGVDQVGGRLHQRAARRRRSSGASRH